jgi:hypothetical protein
VTTNSTLRLPQREQDSRAAQSGSEISAVPLGLLAGVNVGPAPAIQAPDMQHRICPGRAAERRRSRFAFKGFASHIAGMPDLSPEDYAAIAALLRDTIAADRFPLGRRMRG